MLFVHFRIPDLDSAPPLVLIFPIDLQIGIWIKVDCEWVWVNLNHTVNMLWVVAVKNILTVSLFLLWFTYGVPQGSVPFSIFFIQIKNHLKKASSLVLRALKTTLIAHATKLWNYFVFSLIKILNNVLKCFPIFSSGFG